jgi:tetratricopeptide (TPR) repeat protein
MARACHAEGRGDLRRAAGHYRRTLELDPDNVAALLEAGLLALHLGRSDEGLGWLRRALELAPDEPGTLARVARGLSQAGRADEARAALRAALFRRPRDGRFRRLWDDFQFQQLRQRQEFERLQRASDLAFPDGPVLLPFVRPADPATPRPRHDGPATLPAPHRDPAPRRDAGPQEGVVTTPR